METFEVQLISKIKAGRIWNLNRKHMKVERVHFATMGSIHIVLRELKSFLRKPMETFGVHLIIKIKDIKIWIGIWIRKNMKVERIHFATIGPGSLDFNVGC
jgi:hypothetical protein